MSKHAFDLLICVDAVDIDDLKVYREQQGIDMPVGFFIFSLIQIDMSYYSCQPPWALRRSYIGMPPS